MDRGDARERLIGVACGTAALRAVPVPGESLSPASGLVLVAVTLGMLGAVLSVMPMPWPPLRPSARP